MPRLEVCVDAAVSELLQLLRQAAVRAAVLIVLGGGDGGGDFVGFRGQVGVGEVRARVGCRAEELFHLLWHLDTCRGGQDV